MDMAMKQVQNKGCQVAFALSYRAFILFFCTFLNKIVLKLRYLFQVLTCHSQILMKLTKHSVMLLLTACWLLWSLSGYTQQGAMSFEHIGLQAGLSNSTIECILQDKRGFMWFGTRDGLNRYDGYEMVVYRHDETDSTTLSDNYILSIFEDSKGILWIGTANGLNRFDPQSLRFKRYLPEDGMKGSISHQRITAISQDASGRLWVGTWGGGLNMLLSDTDYFECIRYQPGLSQGLPDNYINCLFLDEQQTLWVGTQQGLCVLRDQSSIAAVKPRINGRELSPDVIDLLADKDDRLWIATANGGIIIMDKSSQHGRVVNARPAVSSSLPSNQVRALLADRQGQIWVGSINGGLARYDEQRAAFQVFTNEPGNEKSLSQRTVSALYEDVQGNLWVGTHRGGVNLYSPSTNKFALFRKAYHDNSLVYNDVRTFMEDCRGNIWIGTDGGGINVFDPVTHRFRHYRHDPGNPNSLSSDAVLHLYQDSQQRIWVSTWGGGLNLFNPEKGNFKRYLHEADIPHSIASNYVQQVLEDRKGGLWVATYYGGLLRFDAVSGKFTPFRQGKDVQHKVFGHNVVALLEDQHGQLWISTDDGGLNCYDPESGYVQHYFTREGKIPDIRVLFLDSRQRLWLGHRGLYYFEESSRTFRVYDFVEGLDQQFIRGMLEDDRGALWISTLSGIIRVEEHAKTWRRYNVNDGLQDYEFEPNAALKTREGVLYFGGINGFNIIDPVQLPRNEMPPPVYLTDFQVFNASMKAGEAGSPLEQDISFSEEVMLTYAQSSFSLTFAALNYNAPGNNRYAYRLEGFDHDWVDGSRDRKASYTNLSPGKYRFQVIAANNDGVWNEQGASLDIVIKPPVWGTWWFRTLCFISISAIGFYLISAKRRLELRKSEEKKRAEMYQMQLQFFTNISHEFRTPLSLITGPLEQLMKSGDSNDTQQHLHLMYRNTNRLIGLVDELMDFRKVEDGALHLHVMPTDINQFVLEICEEFNAVAADRNIRFTVFPCPPIQEGWLDRQVVEKILLNLLNNAFKYTQSAGTVSVKILDNLSSFRPSFGNELTIDHHHEAKKYVTICIADSGIGISKASIKHLFERYYRTSEKHLGSGIGLAFVKSLTQLHKGCIRVYSESNKGTEILVSIPCDAADYSSEERWQDGQPGVSMKLESIQQSLPEPLLEPVEHTQPTADKAVAGKPAVLLVEDNNELRSFLSRCLQGEFQVLEAADGAAGWGVAQAQLPGVIISDVMMPKMDGISFCKRIKTTAETQHIPFIMLTAKDHVEDKLSGLQSGADYYFPKPLNVELLKLTLRNCFHGRNILSKYVLDERNAQWNAKAQSEKDQKFMENLMATLAKELSNPRLDVEFLCHHMGLSRTLLYQKVKELTGQPIGDFIRATRLKRAAELMTRDDLPILEVMYRVGIQTQSHFTKAFKKEFGKTPARYMQDLRDRTH